MTASILPIHITQLIRALRPPYASHRLLTTSASRHSAKTALPSIPTCPPESCSCAAMPEGLDINHKRSLKNTMPAYAQHVVIHTGRDDWSSKIEDLASSTTTAIAGYRWTNLARELKKLVGKGGKFHDPSHPVLITNSSSGVANEIHYHSLQLFPQDLYFPLLDNLASTIEGFAWQYLSAASRGISRPELGFVERVLLAGGNPAQRKVRAPTILICGHMSRDSRCGILGPVLKAEFEKHLQMRLKKSQGIPCDDPEVDPIPLSHRLHLNISLCSHVGGHAFAGNVIIHFPADFEAVEGGGLHSLAGKSIWYGRVEPRHVGGIVDETITGGKIIEDLLRGVNSFPDSIPVEQVGPGKYLSKFLMDNEP